MDSSYKAFFHFDTLNATVSDENGARILSDFDDVRYLAGLELCKNEELEEFKFGRDHFNKLRVMPGLIVKLEYETRGNRVISLIDY